MRSLLRALVLVAAIAGPVHAGPAAHSGAVAGKPVRVLPDAAIERNIKAKFAKSKINVEHFDVSVKNGVATIDGKTDVIQHKGVATRLARTGGASAVTNRIQISPQAKAKAAAGLARYRQQGQLARATVIPAKTAAPPAKTMAPPAKTPAPLAKTRVMPAQTTVLPVQR